MARGETETARGNPERLASEPLNIVRVLPFTFRSLDQIKDDLDSAAHKDDVEFTRIILTKKSQESETSHGLSMPLGGKMLEGESALQGARRKLRDESLLFSMGEWWENEEIFRSIEATFTYYIIGKKKAKRVPAEPRTVHTVPFVVIPPEYTLLKPRNPDVSKIESFNSYTPAEFSELINRGKVERSLEDSGKLPDFFSISSSTMAGHFTKVTAPDVFLTSDQRVNQHEVMDAVSARVYSFEMLIHSEVIEDLNQERIRQRLEPVQNIDNCPTEEIIRAYGRVQARWILHDEQKREVESEKPPPGLDLLKFVWFLSGRDVRSEDLSSFLYEAPTQNIQENMRHFVQSFRQAYLAFEKEQIPPEDDKLRKEQVKILKDQLSIEALREKFIAMSPSERSTYIEKLDALMLEAYARRRHVSPEFILEVQREIDEYFNNLYDESLSLNPDFKELFQPTKLMNEVVNAGMGRIFLTANGLYPFIPQTSTGKESQRFEDQRRYEALRKLAFLGHGIPAYRRYRELLDNGNNHHEAILSGNIFSSAQHDERVNRGGLQYTVTHRELLFDVEGKRQHVFVDAKIVKPFFSFLRKSFYEPLDEIHDVFSRNIVLVQDNAGESGRYEQMTNDDFQDYSRRMIARVNTIADRVKEAFLQEFGEQKPGWTVDFIEEKDKFSQLEKSPEQLRKEFEEQSMKGKRPGSMSDFIIRKKYYVVLHDEKGKEYSEELIFYPFDSFEGTPYEDILWGHHEKIQDDALGGYAYRRITEPEPGHPDQPVLYNLFNPPHIYLEHADILWFTGRPPEKFLQLYATDSARVRKERYSIAFLFQLLREFAARISEEKKED